MPTDNLTKELHSYLVRIGINPTSVTPQMEHYLEHLVCLLEPDDEEALLHYFGILGHEQLALDEIARSNHLSPEAMMERIDNCLRKLAVTPEWQMIKQTSQLK